MRYWGPRLREAFSHLSNYKYLEKNLLCTFTSCWLRGRLRLLWIRSMAEEPLKSFHFCGCGLNMSNLRSMGNKNNMWLRLWPSIGLQVELNGAQNSWQPRGHSRFSAWEFLILLPQNVRCERNRLQPSLGTYFAWLSRAVQGFWPPWQGVELTDAAVPSTPQGRYCACFYRISIRDVLCFTILWYFPLLDTL
jgi:hypothetical protein